MNQKNSKSMNSKIGRILIVDDDEIVHLTLKRLLEPEGYFIDSAYGGEQALGKLSHCGFHPSEVGSALHRAGDAPACRRLERERLAGRECGIDNPKSALRTPKSEYDLLILDIRMPDMNGIEVLREIRKRELDIQVLMLTGYATMESATQALNYGARGYLMKPIEDIPEFRKKVSDAVHMARLARENKQFYEAIVSGQVDSLTIDGKVYQVPALREENKEIFQRLMEVIRDAVVFLDFDGNITFANVNFAQMIGESYQNLLEARFDSYAAEEDQDKIIDVLTRLSSGQVAVSIPVQLKTSFGSLLSVIINASPIYYKMEYRGIAMVISDNTEINRVRGKLELLANLVENAQYDMIFIVKPEGQIMECNALARSSFGYSQSEILSLNMGVLFKSGADKRWQKIVASIEQDAHWQGELLAISKHGKEFPIEITVSKPVREVNTSVNMICFMRDISERKQVEENLRTSEANFRNIIAKNADGIVIVDRKGVLRFVNPAAESLLDRKAEEVTGNVFGFPIVVDESSEIDIIRKGKEFAIAEMRVVEIMWEGEIAQLVLLHDITERERAKEIIKSSLEEKEVLLKEIHHRVKNNLQVISSLLDLQADKIKDKEALLSFKESQNRVKTMALIHEKLYQSADLAKIDFSEYLESLTGYLFRSYQVNPNTITMKITKDNVQLDVDTAIPCGLIINELVSNSLKHAFPDGREGEICIDFHCEKDNKGTSGPCRYTLVTRDSGVGLPHDVDIKKSDSLGLTLITTLVKQLRGTLDIYNDNGATFKITFTPKSAA